MMNKVGVLLGVLEAVTILIGVNAQTVELSDLLNRDPEKIAEIMKRVNVSQVEYTTKMGVYTKMTQETSRPRRLSSLSPTKVEGEGSGNEVLRFSLTELSLTEGALLKMFVMGASSVSVYQVVSDGSEALVREIAEMSPGGLWVDSHLNLPGASISESSEIAIRVDCGSNCKARSVDSDALD
ncbi:hypothetical protein GE061_000145, partial [Apolygus lucorum]